MSQRILLVEDEPKIAALVRDYLENARFAVHHLARGEGAADIAVSWPADLVLLDLMLPGEDGLSVCRRIRERSTVPVITSNKNFPTNTS